MPHTINNILITRPKASGEQLAQQLTLAGFASICQPLITYKTTATESSIRQHLSSQQPTILIFVSVAAVNYAAQALALSQWCTLSTITDVIAVGSTTQQALKKHNINSICPATFDSEGMLALPLLNQTNMAHSNITIVRGENGREHLANTLKQRGATVNYLSVYEKVTVNFPSNQAQQWRNAQINCIVVTSNAFLKSLVHLVDITDNYWKNTCLWVVVSQRIADTATALGLHNVINTHGATHQAIVNTLLNMESTYD